MKCSKCNKNIAHTSSFCGYCGEGVFAQKSTSERKKVKKHKIKFQAVLGLFVYLSLFLAFIFITSYNSCSRYCSDEEGAAWGWFIIFIISLVIYLIIIYSIQDAFLLD